jgi:lipoprotein-anchoring transpeptidase ErfK/SrfK
MKPVEGILNFRAVIARGAAWMALLGLVACATTTTPVPRQADPAFARKVVTYSSPVPGTIVIDPANHFLYLVQSGGQAIRYWGRRRRRRLWVVGQG